MASSAASNGEVLVRFLTQVSSIRVPAVPIAVPSELNRKGLSQVIHHLLGVEAEDAPLFEFFHSGSSSDAGAAGPRTQSLLRTSLRRYIAALGLSGEATLTLEYAPAIAAPTITSSGTTEDWILSLDGESGVVLSGLASGAVEVFALAGSSSPLAPELARRGTFSAHRGAVSAVHALEDGCAGAPSGARCSLTGGKDGAVSLWLLGLAQGQAAPRLAPVMSLTGASAGVCCARLDPSGALAAAGDDGGVVTLWRAFSSATSLPDLSAPAAAVGGDAPRPKKSGKRARGGEEEDVPAAAPAGSSGPASRIAPLAHAAGLAGGGHEGPVTGLAWVSSGALASCGWDGTVRVWDAEHVGGVGGGGQHSASADAAASSAPPSSLAAMARMSCDKAANAICASPLGSVLATAHADHCVRLWDTRGRRAAQVATAASKQLPEGMLGCLQNGEAWVSAVAWCPRSSYHLAAADADGSTRLWDTRALSAPLFEVHRHAQRALAAGWLCPGSAEAGGAVYALSGGASKELKATIVPGLSS